MINKKEIFFNTLKEYKQYQDTVDKFESILGTCVSESTLVDIPYVWFDKIMDLIFKKEAVDLFYTFIFDKKSSVTYKDDEFETPEEFWEIADKYNLIRNN